MTMVRADERLANLGVVYMEGDLGSMTGLNDIDFWILKWNVIGNLKAKSATTNQIHFQKKFSFYLTSKWVKFSVICISWTINKFIPACVWQIATDNIKTISEEKFLCTVTCSFHFDVAKRLSL